MNLAALKVFCDLARCRSFSQAGETNDITQSAVSQIVAQMEKRMQVQLVDRSRRPLQLTEPGQRFYDGCISLLEQYAELEAGIRSAQAETVGNVRVVAIYSVGLGEMEEYMRRFMAAGQARVQIEYLHPDRVYERVLEGTADLGLVSFPHPSSKLEALPWREEKMVLACGPAHPLARQPAVRIKELAGQKYVHFDRNLVIRRQVDRFLKEHGIGVDVVLEFDNIENIKQAVAIGAGVALLPEPTLRQEVKAGALMGVPLAKRAFARPLGIIHRCRPRLGAAARCFLELLLEIPKNGDRSSKCGADR